MKFLKLAFDFLLCGIQMALPIGGGDVREEAVGVPLKIPTSCLYTRDFMQRALVNSLTQRLDLLLCGVQKALPIGGEDVFAAAVGATSEFLLCILIQELCFISNNCLIELLSSLHSKHPLAGI